MESEDRLSPQAVRSYAGDGYVVHWEPSLCIHTAACLRRLPTVFDARRRPWVDLTRADVADVADAVRRCPSGALRFERTDGARDEAAGGVTRVIPAPDGPLYVIGEIEVVAPDGGVVRQATRLTLCRCGGSENKPYCDNTHRMNGFRG